MPDCPKCGHGNAATAAFCINSACNAYLGFSTGVVRAPSPTDAPAPPRPPGPGMPPRPPSGPAPFRPAPPPARRPDVARPVQPATSMQPAGGSGGYPPPPGQRRGVRLKVEPTELTVEPGGSGTIAVTVRNTGTRVEEFRVAVRGPAGVFGSVEPPVVSVYPDDEREIVARFSPVRGPQHPAGQVPFEIVASSDLHADVRAAERGTVTVNGFDQLDATMEPEVTRGRRPGLHVVALTNVGNRPLTVGVDLADRDGELTFEPREVDGVLAPGATHQLPVRVGGPKRWFGRTQTHAFTAAVKPVPQPMGPPSMQPPVMLNGTRRQVPVFPWWIPTVALALVAIAIALLALIQPTVPTVVGRTQAEAVRTLTDAGYQAEVVPKPDPETAAGLAISTVPDAGTNLGTGNTVTLFVSLGRCEGECPVPVPGVVGKPLVEAEALLQEATFTTRLLRVPEEKFPRDTVISSDPPARAEVPTGSEVLLTVSDGPAATTAPPTPEGPVELPPVKGKRAGEVQAALAALGLVVTTEPQRTNEVPAGEVLGIRPDSPRLPPGSEVVILVAAPTLVDMTRAAETAEWRDGAGSPVRFGEGVVMGEDELEDGSTDTSLLVRPRPGATPGTVIGRFTLAEPIIAGDHLRARVGLTAPSTWEVTVVVRAGGRVIETLDDGPDQVLKDLDADLSAAAGSRIVEVAVTVAGPDDGSAVALRDFRIAGEAP